MNHFDIPIAKSAESPSSPIGTIGSGRSVGSPEAKVDNDNGSLSFQNSIWKAMIGNDAQNSSWNGWRSLDYLSDFLGDQAFARSTPKQTPPFAMGNYISSADVDTLSQSFRKVDMTPSPGPGSSTIQLWQPPHPPTSLPQGPTPPLVPLFREHLDVKPSIHIIPYKKLNFASFNVLFTVHVMNVPRRLTIASSMIEVIAESPSGLRIPCHLRKCDSYLGFPVFQGCFKATGEMGVYIVQVRAMLPVSRGWSDCGVISESVNMLVSRNYFRDSSNNNMSTFQLEYTSPEVRTQQQNPGNFIPSKIWGLACNKVKNQIFVADRASHLISCMTPDGRLIFQIPREHHDGSLNRPTGLCVDEVNRRLIVSDKDNHRISFFSLDGTYISSFGSMGHNEGMFNYPWDVAVSPDGTVIAVADSRNKRVQLFDRNGKYKGKYSVFEKNPFEYKNNFDYPRGLSFDVTGTLLYVTDFNAQNVMEIPADLSCSRKMVPEGKLRRPQGILVDSVGGLMVCDSRSNCLRHMAPDGSLLATIRSVGSVSIEYPVNVAGLGGGYLAVLDGSGKISIF